MLEAYLFSNTRIVMVNLNLRVMFLHQKELVWVTLLLLPWMLLVVVVEVDQAKRERKVVASRYF